MPERVHADARATRRFFVDMLIRDIGIEGAILDLVDNAVESATKVAPMGDLGGLVISITLSELHFNITDNCGGISVETAKTHAFRFGRPNDYEPATRIGQFGIGMKRAFFRLGNQFSVDSSTGTEQFHIDEDVQEWVKKSNTDWSFDMIVDNDVDGSAGTKLEVKRLHEGVARAFSKDGYADGLLRRISDTYEHHLKDGLEITVNTKAASALAHTILLSANVTPERQRLELKERGVDVDVDIVAGIGPPRRSVTESGWYIYCNGRLVVKADRTGLTGWGVEAPGSATGSPAWHPQYARFRGFVFFEADNPDALPWTTTKSEIDATAGIYAKALMEMVVIVKKFTSFTNALDQEQEAYQQSDGEVQRLIRQALNSAKLTPIYDVDEGLFAVRTEEGVARPRRSESGPSTVNVQFRVAKVRVEMLKKRLGLKTNSQVGRKAFDRMYDEEAGG